MRKISLGSGSGYWGEPLDLTKELAEKGGSRLYRVGTLGRIKYVNPARLEDKRSF